MKLLVYAGRGLGILFALFILLIANLQLSDGYKAYGIISIALGIISIYLVFRSIRNRRNFV